MCMYGVLFDVHAYIRKVVNFSECNHSWGGSSNFLLKNIKNNWFHKLIEMNLCVFVSVTFANQDVTKNKKNKKFDRFATSINISCFSTWPSRSCVNK